MPALGSGNIAHRCLLSADQSTIRRIAYTAADLYTLRSIGRHPAHAVLSTVHELGLLRYRGSCAGRRRENRIPVYIGGRREVYGQRPRPCDFMNGRHVTAATTACRSSTVELQHSSAP